MVINIYLLSNTFFNHFPQSTIQREVTTDDKNEDSKERISETDAVSILRTRAAGRVFPGESWCDGKESLKYTKIAFNLQR